MATDDARAAADGVRTSAPAKPGGGVAEEARIKLSSVVSDLLGVCGRRILEALSQGETDAMAVAGFLGVGMAPRNLDLASSWLL